MRKIWIWISFLGITDNDNSADRREVILANRVNFILLVLSVVLFFIAESNKRESSSYEIIDNYRLLVQAFVCLLSMYFSYMSWHKTTRFLLITVPLLVLVFLPAVLFNVVNEDNYLYFPNVLIALSIFGQLLFNLPKERIKYLIFVLFYLILIVFLETILWHCTERQYDITRIIKQYFTFIKTTQVSIYVFLTSSVYYLKTLNSSFEVELAKKNITLDQQKEEIQAAFENLKNTQNQLVQTAKMASLGVFTSGVAHEINNPLNFIQGGSEILSKSCKELLKTIELDEDQKKVYSQIELSQDMIFEGTSRASEIVKRIMEASSRGVSVPEYADVNRLLDNALLILKSKVPEGVKISTDFKLQQEAFVNKTRLQQAFISILDNAFYAAGKYELRNKYVKISSELKKAQDDEIVIVSIFNSGNPIPEENLSRVFDPFFTTKEPGEGAGLGLAMAYGIIHEHEGSIEVSNEPKGVKFTINLPIKKQI
ncbi:MAG: GHKL domain-containing protein [Bacteroidales bacterium]|nr:GHKL domain-containing protein [Bacteroidales bacterium]MBN2817985.1 GHKL domain-containing protein [Bacteroidales bacterium]